MISFKPIFLALFLALSAACSPALSPAPAVPAASDAERALPIVSATAAIVRNDDDGRLYASCSAVWVERDLLITANHCVRRDDAGTPESELSYAVESDVLLPDGSARSSFDARRALVLRLDPEHDLALLRADPASLPAHAVAPLRSSPISRGERVRCVGHTIGLWWSFSSGDVAAVRRDADGVLLVQTTAPVWKGNSGGGLFDDEGRLVGICSKVSLRAPSVAWFVHVQHVAALRRIAICTPTASLPEDTSPSRSIDGASRATAAEI